MGLNNNTSDNDTNSLNSESQPPLNLPPVNLRLKREGELIKVYDSLRCKYVTLTPEEYVRQHFVHYLNTSLHYPLSIMANEVGVELNGTKKRCDTVIFNLEGKPDVIVEYKAPGVQITQDVFDQIVRYNMILRARYLIVSNGMNHYCCRIDYNKNNYYFIKSIPDYSEVINPSLPN